jgi:hypothetical protein
MARRRTVTCARLDVFETCKELIRQLKSAPIAADGMDAGEAVDKRWEGEHGHAVAAARYGAMSRPAPAGPPDPGEPDDWRTYVLRERLRKQEVELGLDAMAQPDASTTGHEPWLDCRDQDWHRPGPSGERLTLLRNLGRPEIAATCSAAGLGRHERCWPRPTEQVTALGGLQP